MGDWEALLPSLPPTVLLIIYIVVQNWDDIKRWVGRIYQDRTSHLSDIREAGQHLQETVTSSRVRQEEALLKQFKQERKDALEILRAYHKDLLDVYLRDWQNVKTEIGEIQEHLDRFGERLVDAWAQAAKDQSAEIAQLKHSVDLLRRTVEAYNQRLQVLQGVIADLKGKVQ